MRDRAGCGYAQPGASDFRPLRRRQPGNAEGHIRDAGAAPTRETLAWTGCPTLRPRRTPATRPGFSGPEIVRSPLKTER